MKKINIRKIYYHIRHRYLTMNNVVVVVAFIIGASWAWGSITMMQRNYGLQKEIDSKNRQEKLVELETLNLTYQKKYYQSGEYQALAVRERLGYVDPGEKVLVLPPNTLQTKTLDLPVTSKQPVTSKPISNFQQWMNFLFGGNKAQSAY